LSKHVVTRHYRAPELITLEPEYDEGVDLWSVGCIAAEMMMKQQSEDTGILNKYRPFFRGEGSFPLSPNPHHKYTINSNYSDEND